MPLLRLIAEGVGPFERLDIDLSDGKGNPHLGPHIFAGVNGSGKSTVLRALACVLSGRNSGFPYEEWGHLLTGYSHSRVLAIVQPPGAPTRIWAWSGDTETVYEFSSWVKSVLTDSAGRQLLETSSPWLPQRDERPGAWWVYPRSAAIDRATPNYSIAAYSPSRALRHLVSPDITKTLSDPRLNCLAFE
jgi:hypothetical protein